MFQPHNGGQFVPYGVGLWLSALNAIYRDVRYIVPFLVQFWMLRRLPRLRAAWRMFLGNVLTSFVGLLVAVMIASSPVIWPIGVPIVCFLC